MTEKELIQRAIIQKRSVNDDDDDDDGDDNENKYKQAEKITFRVETS